MKVRVFDDVRIISEYITDARIKNLLLDNGVSSFVELREQIIDIDLKNIILEEDVKERGSDYEMGYTYCNRLYDIIHDKHKLRGSDFDLQYEIIEEGFLEDIPWCETIFETTDGFNAWMKKCREENK